MEAEEKGGGLSLWWFVVVVVVVDKFVVAVAVDQDAVVPLWDRTRSI